MVRASAASSDTCSVALTADRLYLLYLCRKYVANATTLAAPTHALLVRTHRHRTVTHACTTTAALQFLLLQDQYVTQTRPVMAAQPMPSPLISARQRRRQSFAHTTADTSWHRPICCTGTRARSGSATSPSGHSAPLSAAAILPPAPLRRRPASRTGKCILARSRRSERMAETQRCLFLPPTRCAQACSEVSSLACAQPLQRSTRKMQMPLAPLHRQRSWQAHSESLCRWTESNWVRWQRRRGAIRQECMSSRQNCGRQLRGSLRCATCAMHRY